MKTKEPGSPSKSRHPATGILLGMAAFIASSSVFLFFVAPYPVLILDLDPSERWWQRVGYFVVCFLPLLGFAAAGGWVSARTSGKRAGLVTLAGCLTLVVSGFAALAVLYPYEG